MAIQFERREKVTRYRDPNDPAVIREIRSEIRWDPLTRRTARVAHFVGFQLAPVDFGELASATRSTCPFCPENVNRVTPQFPPDLIAAGRIQRGHAVVFPNLSPYDEHSAVTVMGPEHFVPLDKFGRALLSDAWEASRAYLQEVGATNGTLHALINWNYMPPAGGSQIHPHWQVFATDTTGNTHREELEGSARYRSATGRSFWADWVEAEEKLRERFVARGAHTVWCTSFVSDSPLSDLLILFPERATVLELPDAAVDEFLGGLMQVFRYLAGRGVYSFNLAAFPGPAGQRDDWLHFRLSPRLYLSPYTKTTDTSTLQHLYREPFMIWPPEAEAERLQQALRL
jgi:UDPglucose--hexose-1-phosphate uridylyltransferase